MPSPRLRAALERMDALINWERRDRTAGMRVGLEPARALLEELGLTDLPFRCVHVTGSKGKGSVSALIAEGLRGAGLRVGRYGSPHVERVNERVTFDDGEIEDDALAEALEAALAARERGLAHGTAAGEASWFDLMTGAAFLAFARAGIDWAVVEVGLGGRLDSTNVIRPELCVLTAIELEHRSVLGPTLAHVAREKAGILKAGAALVCGFAGPMLEGGEGGERGTGAEASVARVGAARAVAANLGAGAVRDAGSVRDVDSARAAVSPPGADSVRAEGWAREVVSASDEATTRDEASTRDASSTRAEVSESDVSSACEPSGTRDAGSGCESNEASPLAASNPDPSADEPAFAARTPAEVVAARARELGLEPTFLPAAERGPLSSRNELIARAALDRLGARGSRGPAGPIGAGCLTPERLAAARLPGRIEWRRRGSSHVMLDGAHTASSVGALLDEVAATRAGRPWFVFALGKDKELDAILAAIVGRVAGLICTELRTGVHRDAEAIAAAARAAGLPAVAVDSPADALDEACARAGDAPVVVTGSLYLVGELRAALAPADREG